MESKFVTLVKRNYFFAVTEFKKQSQFYMTQCFNQFYRRGSIFLFQEILVKNGEFNKPPKGLSYDVKCIVKIMCLIIVYTYYSRISGIIGMNKIRNIITNSNDSYSCFFWSKMGMYLSSNSECLNESINEGRSYYKVNIDVNYCFFSRLSVFSGYGGVIFASGGSFYMSISSSTFFRCSCSNNGGAIYFDSVNSSLEMICAYNCSASNFHFALLQVTQNVEIEYLSITLCSCTASGESSVYLLAGIQRLFNSNSSKNYAKMRSGIDIKSPSSFISSHCTFSNNYVTDYYCIWLYYSSGSISFTNIVHNNSPTSGVFCVDAGVGMYQMYFCIFDLNQDILFCVYSGTLELFHSLISHSGTFSTRTSVLTSNNNSIDTLYPLENRQTHHLIFFESHMCNADFPLYRPTSKNTAETTIQNSLMRTNDETFGKTPSMTPPRTYDEKQRTFAECILSCQVLYRREIKVLFSYSYFFMFS